MTTAEKNYTASLGLPPEKIAVLAVAPRTNAMPRHGARYGAEALDIAAAWRWLDNRMQSDAPAEAVHVSGPGEPLAEAREILELLDLMHDRYPDLAVFLTTNGLGLPEVLDELITLGLAEVTLRMDAVDPEIAALIYAWVRPGKRTVPLQDGVLRLLGDQAESLRMLSEKGIGIVVESRCIPGVNSGHLPEVAEKAAAYEIEGMRIVPGRTELAECDADLLRSVRDKCAAHVEILPEVRTLESPPPEGLLDQDRPYVAVASTEGASVDAHLGQAGVLMIYGFEGGASVFKEARETPAPGTEGRWNKLAEILSDCRAVLAAHAGEAPRKALAENGIRLFEAAGGIDGAVKKVFQASSDLRAPSCSGGC